MIEERWCAFDVRASWSASGRRLSVWRQALPVGERVPSPGSPACRRPCRGRRAAQPRAAHLPPPGRRRRPGLRRRVLQGREDDRPAGGDRPASPPERAAGSVPSASATPTRSGCRSTRSRRGPRPRRCDGAGRRARWAEYDGGDEETEPDQPAQAARAGAMRGGRGREQQADRGGQQHQPDLDRGEATDLLEEHRDHEEGALQGRRRTRGCPCFSGSWRRPTGPGAACAGRPGSTLRCRCWYSSFGLVVDGPAAVGAAIIMLLLTPGVLLCAAVVVRGRP